MGGGEEVGMGAKVGEGEGKGVGMGVKVAEGM